MVKKQTTPEVHKYLSLVYMFDSGEQLFNEIEAGLAVDLRREWFVLVQLVWVGDGSVVDKL